MHNTAPFVAQHKTARCCRVDTKSGRNGALLCIGSTTTFQPSTNHQRHAHSSPTGSKSSRAHLSIRCSLWSEALLQSFPRNLLVKLIFTMYTTSLVWAVQCTAIQLIRQSTSQNVAQIFVARYHRRLASGLLQEKWETLQCLEAYKVVPANRIYRLVRTTRDWYDSSRRFLPSSSAFFSA